MVFGSYDFLHLGHLKFFEEAKKHGGKLGKLIVCLARDENAAKTKGRTPFFSESERLKLVSSLRAVDKALLGDKKDFFKAVKKEKPNVIVLGYDQPADEKAIKATLAKLGLKTKVIRLKKSFLPHKCKSSKIREYLCA